MSRTMHRGQSRAAHNARGTNEDESLLAGGRRCSGAPERRQAGCVPLPVHHGVLRSGPGLDLLQHLYDDLPPQGARPQIGYGQDLT